MIGDILKKSREELGLDLKEVANTLRIQYEYLKAIESNNLKKLPADVYTKGYIREYARFLNIDPMPLINEYMDYLGKQNVEIQPESPPVRKRFAFPRIVFLVLVIIVIGTVLVIYFPKTETPLKENRIVRKESKLSTSKASPQAESTLSVIATETTWLRIEMEEGKSEEVLMRPGETKRWESHNGFNLKLGNAGGVRLILNDKDMGIPGEKGQVLRIKLP